MLPPSIRPTVDAHVRAAWQEQMAAAGKTPGLLPELMQRQQELLPRFAVCYTQLRALPRRVRRALQRKWKHSLAGVALLLALGQEPVLAATINVSGGCSLINAITAANIDTATGGCPQGSGADTIRLPVGSTQTLTAVNNSTYGPTGLPVISSQITIEGRNSTIQRGSSAPDFRILAVSSMGDLILKETTISGGIITNAFPVSYAGGGVLNRGALTLQNSTISGNSAFASGGGVSNGGVLTLNSSTIANNGIENGGGGGVSSSGILTITNSTVSGNTTGTFGDGGGVRNDGILTIQNSTLSGNRGGGGYGGGGGVLNTDTATIEHSTISGNVGDAANFGGNGGGGVLNSGTMTIRNSRLSGNAGFTEYGTGGGGAANSGTLIIQNSTIADNLSNYGGGVGNSDTGVLTIESSTLSGNAAGFGGGVENSGTLTLTNSTISGNTASGYINANYFGFGGGVANQGVYATLTITNSTISGNTNTVLFPPGNGSGAGAGVANRGGTLTLAHTLVSGNTAPTSPEIYSSDIVTANAFNLFGHDGNAGVSGFSPGITDVVPTDPLSDILDTTLANNGGPTLTHALVAGSPAVDAITTGCPPPDTDQRGFLRPADGDNTPGALCDIGSFEFNATPAVREVTIDIKPGASPNTINLKSNGVIPVAILTTQNFNATTVDPLSVEFGPEGATEAHGRGHREDVNGDGKLDLLLHFRTQATGIQCGDTEASFTGETFQGEQIQGSDAIKTIGCKKP